MNMPKRAAMIFLGTVNLMNIIAGIMTMLKITLGKDFTSIIPISAQLTVNQILILNFAVVVALMLMISIVTTYLVTDIPYSPIEVISNCPGVFMVLPLIVFGVAVFNAVNADVMADKVWIIVGAVFYVIANAVNFGCFLTVKEDAE